MITYTVACPHCQQTEPVVKYGTTKAGTQRAKCNACHKTFALTPKSRAVTPEKEAAILRQLEERTSIRGICRALKCSCQTVYRTLKKSRDVASF
jgi:transposase-like protein